MFSGDVGVGDESKNTSKEDVNLKEGNGDSEEDSIPNFVDNVSNMVVGVNVNVKTSNPSSSGKRKVTQNCSNKSFKKKRGSGMGTQLLLRLDKLVNNVFIKSDYGFYG